MSGMMDSNDLFEIKAATFYRDTGMLAPGKDSALPSPSYETRLEVWDLWRKVHGQQVEFAIQEAAEYWNIHTGAKQ